MRARLKRLMYFLAAFVLYTAYKAIQLWPTQPILAASLAVVFFAVMMTGSFAYRARPHIYDQAWFRIVSWAGSIAMAMWATFFLISLPLDLFRVVTAIFGQSFLNVHTYYYVFFAVLILTFLGFLQVVFGPIVKNVEVKIEGLRPELEGLKFAQISDLHVGTTIRKSYVSEVVRKTNEIEADFIFLTGDIADAHVGSIPEHLEPLSKLRAKHGCYYVPGNHEYYWDPKALLEKFRELGMNVLINENRIVKIGAASILVGGITDPAGQMLGPSHAPNAKLALESKHPVDLKLLLAHQPGAYVAGEPLGAHIQFSGHTHAGQFFPFSLFIGLAHKYSRGLYRHGRLWVYVNPGTGYWGPADRLGVSAEITCLSISKG